MQAPASPERLLPSVTAVNTNATLFDGKTAAGCPAAASMTATHLALSTADGEPMTEWPLASLKRTDADVPGASATFRAGAGIERLEIHDAALLTSLHQAGIGRPSPGGWSARGWAAIAAGFALSLAVAALFIEEAPALAVHFVPHSLERGWSAGIGAALSAGSTRCTGAAGRHALSGLIGRLADSAGVSPAPPFTVLDNPMINAFTLPDGHIVIMQGLIAKAEDPDELAGVIAHELGHVSKRDPTRETLRRLELNMLARSLGWGGSLAGQMTALSYGRRAEATADASALQTLQSAHLRADGLARFFRLLQKSDGSDGLPAFLSDHPTTESRALSLQASTNGDTALDQAGWSAVRSMCDKK
jgi:Zn-dependent protease with chaperone function